MTSSATSTGSSQPPTNALQDFGTKYQKAVDSRLYQSLAKRPELKSKVDDVLYNSYVRANQKSGTNWMQRYQWDAYNPQQRLSTIKGTKFQPGVNVSQDTLEQMRKQDVSPTTQVAATVGGVSKSVLDAVINPVALTTAAFLYAPAAMIANEGQRNVTAKAISDATDWKDNLIAGFEHKYGVNQIDSHISTKILNGAGYFGAMLALLPELPTDALLGLARTGKGAEAVYETTGLISKAGGLSKFLSSNVAGRTILRSAHGALDAALFSGISGDRNMATDIGYGVGLEAAVGPYGRFIAEETGLGAKQLYAKLGTLFGGLFVRSSINKAAQIIDENPIVQQAVEQEAKATKRTVGEVLDARFGKGFWQQSDKDPLITKLNEVNAKNLNVVSKLLYKGRLYNFLKDPEKIEVVKRLHAIAEEAFTNPSAYDKKAVEAQIYGAEQKAKQGDPEINNLVTQLETLTKNATGKPSYEAAADTIQKGAQKDNSDKIVQPTTPTGTVPRINVVREVPGAAAAKSREFQEKFPGVLQALQMNEYAEDINDRLGTEVLKVQYGLTKGKKADKIVKMFEDTFPDPEFRFHKLEGLKEHYMKLYYTGHLGKGENVFRSGNYISDAMRGKYNMPMSDWQEELENEWRVVNGQKEVPLSRIMKTLNSPTGDIYQAATPTGILRAHMPTQIRKDSKGNVVAWMSPKDMRLYNQSFNGDPNKALGAMLPGELIKRGIYLLDQHGGDLSKRLSYVLKEALSHTVNGDGPVMLMLRGRSLGESKETLKEEFFHTWQREQLKLNQQRYNDLHAKVPASLKQFLEDVGYGKYSDPEMNIREIVDEASAKLSTQPIHELGTTIPEGVQFLMDYFAQAREHGGVRALQEVGYVSKVGRIIKKYHAEKPEPNP